jgi:molecular chaperone GrpE
MLKPKKDKMKTREDENIMNKEQDENASSETQTQTESENNIQELEKQLNTLRDQLLRKAAEFENYKKRTENEISSLYKYANESLIIDLLPVLDDFDRVMKSWNDKHDAETLRKGIELIYDKFKKVLQKQGVKEIDSTGKQFNVNEHDALLQTPVKDVPPNTVTDTIEKGYYLKDKVIRHAKVIVSNEPEEGENIQ